MGLGLLDFAAGLLDKKPVIPAAPNVSYLDQAKAATDFNKAAVETGKGVASELNSFNFDQLQAMLRKSIPGYDNLLTKTRGIVDSELSGQIPQDVQDQIQRSSAARSFGGGYGGSGMSQNLTARDLGLTSLNMIDKGLDNASKWIASSRAQTPQLFDITSMFINPDALVQNEWNNQLSAFQRNTASNNIDQQYSWQHQAAEGIRADSANLAEIAKNATSSAIGGAMCWVARAVFGEENPEWKMFRNWMCFKAPSWFYLFYQKHGEKIAEFIKDKPMLKWVIRKWMRSRIASMRNHPWKRFHI